MDGSAARQASPIRALSYNKHVSIGFESINEASFAAELSAAVHVLFEKSCVSQYSLLDAAPGARTLRDITRGGLATTLNEIARQSGVGVQLDEGQQLDPDLARR